MLIKEEKILVDITSIKIIHSNIFDNFLTIGFYIAMALLTILFIYWSINTVIFIYHFFNIKKKTKKKTKNLKQNKTRMTRTKRARLH